MAGIRVVGLARLSWSISCAEAEKRHLASSGHVLQPGLALNARPHGTYGRAGAGGDMEQRRTHIHKKENAETESEMKRT